MQQSNLKNKFFCKKIILNNTKFGEKIIFKKFHAKIILKVKIFGKNNFKNKDFR